MNKWKTALFKSMEGKLLALMQAEFNKRWVMELKAEESVEFVDRAPITTVGYSRADGVEFTPAQAMFVETYIAAYTAAINQVSS